MEKQINNTIQLVIKETKKNFGIVLNVVLDANDVYRININDTKIEKVNKALFNMLFIKEKDLQNCIDSKAIFCFKDGSLQMSFGKGLEVPEGAANIMQKIGKWVKDLESNMNMIVTGLLNCPVEVYPIYRGTVIIIGIQDLLLNEGLINPFSYFVLPKVEGKKALIIRNLDEKENVNLTDPNLIELWYYADKYKEELYIRHFLIEGEEEIEICGLTDNEVVNKAFEKVKEYLKK